MKKEIMGLAIVALVLILGWIAVSHFEARAYNQITGQSITTWQAMFVNLRVQAEPKGDVR